jgi:hypothetical protein
MLADILGGTTKGDIEEAPLAMAANDKHISLDLVDCLHNDTARVAHAEESCHL